ncbi:hypothetical protein CNMCM5793_000073 [Aspergillus hiratsukae]|uniref:Uncharacterized protein n=1 Tax=Aspergillus hiratsukae TaxID=1194566 RepID=A0A8H6P9E6_9EURO|nr:hypothetical protein CNMCM5793_000073 [Aspergillus hiratsukae]KAF7167667.1 hypothetical protein CNMCM6106_003119 [Aspergillus hiratsukae]
MDNSEQHDTDNTKTEMMSLSQYYRRLFKFRDSINSTNNGSWTKTAKQLIADGVRAEKENQDVIDWALAIKAELDKKLIELTSAPDDLESALKSQEMLFITLIQVVEKLIGAHEDDADGVQEVMKYMQETIDKMD